MLRWGGEKRRINSELGRHGSGFESEYRNLNIEIYNHKLQMHAQITISHSTLTSCWTTITKDLPQNRNSTVLDPTISTPPTLTPAYAFNHI